MCLSLLCDTDVQGESNGYSVLSEAELPGGESQMNEGCVHSSDEEKESQKEPQPEGAIEGHSTAHDCSGSRPLLMDSEDEEEQGLQETLNSATQPSPAFQQPVPSTFTQHPHKADVTTDIFSKVPFNIGQEDSCDVFASAPFPRAPLPAQQQFDVFSQAPFGKKKQVSGAQLKSTHPHAVGVQGGSPVQVGLGQIAQQPFRPQALAKYSRHFEGPVLQQPAAAHQVVSNMSKQAAPASVPTGPLQSWTLEVSAVDPFISAPFHLKAPQEKPWVKP